MARLRFDRFSLDPDDRLLRHDDRPVELNARYLDALILLAQEPGKLISKDRFLAEIWRGVPVTDEALTQCIKTLRRQLGDDAGRPRFIETVPKHGYRFIATVEPVGTAAGPTLPTPDSAAPGRDAARRFLWIGGAGALGGGGAGLLGGLLYGFVGASQALQPGVGQPNGGALSVLVVLASLTLLVALLGGAGVAFGIAAAELAGNPSAGRHRLWQVLGGAGGGLVVGAFGKLLGLDAFTLLFGRTPGNITGAAEGAALGAAVAAGAVLAGLGERPLAQRIGIAALATGAGGVLIALAGGRLMGGSLALLAGAFPDSRLRLDQLGSLFGESGFGPVSQLITGGLEGMLFGAGIVGAMLLARRRLARV